MGSSTELTGKKRKPERLPRVRRHKQTHKKQRKLLVARELRFSSPKMRGQDLLRAAAERDRVAQKALSKRVALLPPGAHDDSARTGRSAYENHHFANGRAVAAEYEKEFDAIYLKYGAHKATKRAAPPLKEKRAPGTCSPPVPPRVRSSCPIPCPRRCAGLCRRN